jgi:dephospho-CoA kinase
MLRVGLTGGIGSGKSAVARVWADEGVPILEADALGRALMQPGQAVYAAIVERFGAGVVAEGGQLDRAALAREAFDRNGLAALNAIVHPAVIAAQQSEFARLEATGLHAIAVVESALIFEASGESGIEAPDATPVVPASVPGWRDRFDRLVLVAAPEAVRIERFVLRVGGPEASSLEKERLRGDALRRLAAQLPEAWKRDRCDYLIENDRTLVLLRRRALEVLRALRTDAVETLKR